MKTKFSQSWNKSTQRRKQRKFRYNAPLHVRRKLMGVHLSAELRKKHNKRSIVVKKGDTVKVLRGDFRKKQGKVESVDLKRGVMYVNGIEVEKKNGTKVRKSLQPSNVMIIELNLDDKKRKQGMERK